MVAEVGDIVCVECGTVRNTGLVVASEPFEHLCPTVDTDDNVDPPDQHTIVVLCCDAGHFLPWPAEQLPYPTECTQFVRENCCGGSLTDPGTRFAMLDSGDGKGSKS